jgi:sortase A
MLLRIGVIAMTFSVAITAGVALAVVWRGDSAAEQPIAPERVSENAPPHVSGNASEAVERAARRPETGSEGASDRQEPASGSQPRAEEELESEESRKRSRPGPDSESLPVGAEDWPEPAPEEVRLSAEPRYFELPPGSVMSLTIEAIGIYNAPVFDEESRQALNSGVIHIPETPMPWKRDTQKNVYLAGHRLGYPGTGSRLIFYRLPELKRGNRIVLRDKRGGVYTYEVSEMFEVDPYATWPVQPVRDRDMVTLQTCSGPDYQKRLIVRADRARAVGF